MATNPKSYSDSMQSQSKFQCQRNGTSTTNIYMESQKTLNCQSNPDKREEDWWHHSFRFQTVLHTYHNKNRTVLRQKPDTKTIGIYYKPRNKTIAIWTVNLQQRSQDLKNKWCWENWTVTYKKMKTTPLFHNIHKKQSYTKFDLKWINYLNVGHIFIKYRNENTG